MNAQELVSSLATRIGLSGLSLAETGACSVIFEEDEVVFEDNNQKLFVFAEIGPAAGRETLYADLLDANHLGHGTAYGSIGLDRQRDVFTLCRVVELPCEYEQFEEQLALFINVLRHWKKQLSEL
ncbi:MAG: type III secretion system chaperone [Succinivibrio sp.]|nr:type III secretion system chaperone [Succinivibrio sp.]